MPDNFSVIFSRDITNCLKIKETQEVGVNIIGFLQVFLNPWEFMHCNFGIKEFDRINVNFSNKKIYRRVKVCREIKW